jgi:hypothetical protein
LYRTSTGLVYLRNTHSQGIAHASFFYGNPNDRFVAGDWNADDKDSAGVLRPSALRVYLRYHNSAGNADAMMDVGSSALVPVSGFLGNL